MTDIMLEKNVFSALDNEEMENISGGVGPVWGALVAGAVAVAAVVTVFTLSVEAGKSIGGAIYYATH